MPLREHISTYWADMANLEREIHAFIAQHGVPGKMPPARLLHAHGRLDLLQAIGHHGGIVAVSKRLGLQTGTQQRPSGYWNDVATLERELRAFLATQPHPEQMPSQRTFQRLGRYDLLQAIQRHGGLGPVATRLGVASFAHSRVPKPIGYWDDLANFERELRTFIAEQGVDGQMPNNRMLEAARRSDLIAAIARYGGMAAVAQRFGLTRPQPVRAKRYWDDFAHVAHEIQGWIAAHGTPGVMPNYGDLTATRQLALYSGIQRHGGMAAVAERLNLTRPKAAKPYGYWNDVANLDRELRAFLVAQQLDGVMPTARMLAAAGRTDLAGAILQHGGYQAVAHRLGFARPASVKPAGAGYDIAIIEQELRAFLVAQQLDGVMPTARMLTAAHREDLVHAIKKHGGFQAITARLGLQPSRQSKPVGYWDDFTHVEDELRTFMGYGNDSCILGPQNITKRNCAANPH